MTIPPIGRSLNTQSPIDTNRLPQSQPFAQQLLKASSESPAVSNSQETDAIDANGNTVGAYRAKETKNDDELRSTFQTFVGQTMFSQMIASMRSTQEEPAYFHGGQAERIFQSQLDQVLSEEITKSSAAQISDPMFKLFQLRRN